MSGIGDLLEACARCALAQGSAACGAYYDDDQSLVVTLEDEAIGRLRRTSSRIPSTSIVLVLALLNVLLGHATADDGTFFQTTHDPRSSQCCLFVLVLNRKENETSSFFLKKQYEWTCVHVLLGTFLPRRRYMCVRHPFP